MAIISRTDDTEAILQQDGSFMLRMDKAFNCWIQAGRLNSENQLVADGERIAQVTTEVFDALTPSMEQVFCSEYFQVLEEDGRRASDNLAAGRERLADRGGAPRPSQLASNLQF